MFDHAPGPGKTPKDVTTHSVVTPRRQLSFSEEKGKSSEPKKLEKAKSTPELDEPKASLKRLKEKTADTFEKPEEIGKLKFLQRIDQKEKRKVIKLKRH